MDETTEKELTYAAKGTPLKTSEETEKLEGGSAAAGGTAGTGSNVPTYSNRNGNGDANSNYERAKKDTDYGVNKKVRDTKIAAGAVNKLNVALLVDKSVPADVFDRARDDGGHGRRPRHRAR